MEATHENIFVPFTLKHKEKFGFYLTQSPFLYLHSDGKVYGTTCRPVDGQYVYSGYYATPEDAARAVDKWRELNYKA